MGWGRGLITLYQAAHLLDATLEIGWGGGGGGVGWGVITLDEATHLLDATLEMGWGGEYCLRCCMHSIPTPRCTLLAREHEPTSEMFGEVKRQNPPCAHWPGDLVDWEPWEFQNTSFRKKGRVSKYNWSVAKYKREASECQLQNATV